MSLNPFKLQLELRISIMQAHLDGKKIECRNNMDRGDVWAPVCTPSWNWDRFDYRVAPPPLTERWAMEYPGGTFYGTFDSQSAADRYNDLSYGGKGRVYLMREVR